MSGQGQFGAALLDPAQPAPKALRNPFGGSAGKRFDVYRNNVAVSLTQALETGFPTIAKLVGDDFFKAMAGVYLRANPPADPRLALYGTSFPGFLARFAPVAHLRYLPDVARLDLGLRQSYHAADAAPFDTTGIDPAAVMALSPRLAPATLVLSSRHPVHGIWRYNTTEGAPKPAPGAQDVLLARKGFDPMPYLLPPGGLTFARALKGRLTLSDAMTRTLADHPKADIAALVTLFFTSGALTGEPDRHS
ncbi:DNA-binding domain-containing protein [Roseicyclus mahoneyensis]|uniref:Putative DNA-binding protein n=1 Tax=Roseicyclus mahoneyensis TaxID=164332 RepID=A0A316GLD8_9RHOB|nr:DNA-binding domain-containing protein [Roseicyclus mahoneyensis]PWK61018.1 putative DNA-binding protein [Roseicyclus mahoneyensis]